MTNQAMSSVKTIHTRSPELQDRQSYRRPGKTSGTPHVSRLVTFPLCRSLSGKQLENQMHHHGNTRVLRKRCIFGNHWACNCSLKTASAISLIQSNLALFPKHSYCCILTKRSYLVMRKASRPYETASRHG